MISLTVPTMWRGKQFETMLPKLLDHPKIGEVIIVDNDIKARFFELPKHKKLKVLVQKQNIFCHPAWNLGVAESKYDKNCLMNDDILFDVGVFDLVYEMITPKIGIIGVNGENIKSFYVNSPLMCVNPTLEFPHWRGYGTLMFFHKKSYLTIPDEFPIWWGDVWIYDYNAVQKRQNYVIDKFCVNTEMRTTSKGMDNLIKKENDIHEQIFDKMYKEYTKPGVFLSKPICKHVYETILEYGEPGG